MAAWAAAGVALLVFAHPLWLLASLIFAGLSYLSFTEAKAALARYQSERSSTCSGAGSAVQYEGWYGSVHTFVFTSTQYGTAFQLANQKKLVEPS